MWEKSDLPLAFLLKVRTRERDTMTSWRTFHTLDAWLPLTVNTDTRHQFMVLPVLPNGVAGKSSKSGWIHTHSGHVAIQPPKDVRVIQEVTSQQPWILIEWTPPAVPVCHYELFILPETAGVTTPEVKRLSWLPEAKVRFGPLEFSTTYIVRLVSCTRQFTCTEDSTHVTFRTRSCVQLTGNPHGRCDPEAPSGVKVTRLGLETGGGCLQSVSVQWDTPGQSSIHGTTYRLTWQEQALDRSHIPPSETSISVNTSRQTVSGLVSNSEYYFTLTTVTTDGRLSDPLSFIINTTSEDSIVCVSHTSLSSTPWLHVVLPCVIASVILLLAVLVAYRCVKEGRVCWVSTGTVPTRGSTTNPLYIPVGDSPNKHPDLVECHTATDGNDGYEVSHSQLNRHELLGEGAFGAVYRGTLTPSPLLNTRISDPGASQPIVVAIKYLKETLGDDEKARLLEEIELMKNLGRHPNVVSMIGCVSRGHTPALVLDYCPHGDLRAYLRTLRLTYVSDTSGGTIRHHSCHSDSAVSDMGGPSPTSSTAPVPIHLLPTHTTQGRAQSRDGVTEHRLLSYARQVAVGMDYLATKKFVHRDLAARNVLVCERHLVKISDFGLTRDVYEDSVYHKAGGGKLPVKWMSIEAIFDQIYTTQSDVWSFGVLLWEIVTLGGSPYPGVPSHDLYRMVKDGYRMECPDNCSEEIYAIMMSCWEAEPSDRPTFTQLKEQFDSLLEAKLESECAYISFNMDSNQGYYSHTTDSSQTGVGEGGMGLDVEVSCNHTADIDLSSSVLSV